MAILLFLLWIIWNGRLSVEIILFGVLLTVPAFLFGVKVLGYSLESERRFWRNFPLFLLYTLTLIREIFKAGRSLRRRWQSHCSHLIRKGNRNR